MKKYRFKIQKYTLNNGRIYYICRVKIFHPFVLTSDGVGLWLRNYTDNERNLNKYGGSYWNEDNDVKFKSRQEVLDGIELYMKNREDEDGDEIKSIETEIIWR